MSFDKNQPLYSDLSKSVASAKLFVVGAGGIGCELLKNLVLTGFRDIEVIDLDTIDVSNLNRQFLFQKKHVGMSKASVAKESVLRFCPSAKINARHDTIFNPEYNMQFFKDFDLVLNALDNTKARNHVNRMCLAAGVPLIESGSAGYLGQVTVIKKGLTECYECTPAPKQKSFPGCTIRNTPSELIHCIVWAKYLFNQLFGEEDADQDVSPDTEDPEAAKHKEEEEKLNSGEEKEDKLNSGEEKEDKLNSGEEKEENSAKETIPEGIKRRSTRQWANDCDYEASKIFSKLFDADIQYLLSMDKLWQKRRAPTPVKWEKASENIDGEIPKDVQRVLSMPENCRLFKESISELKERVRSGDGVLTWDKDDSAAMNFTCAAANVRANIFGIPEKSRFQVKSMAGNIIPAIATTNAIVAGLIVMQALCIVREKIKDCRMVFVCKVANATKKLLVPCSLDPPKSGCYVCAEKPEVTVELNVKTFTLLELRDKLLKSALGMLAPDVEILDGRGTVLLSSEDESPDAGFLGKTLREFQVIHGSRLRADDFLQNYDLVLNFIHEENLENEETFRIVGKSGTVSPKEDKATGDGAKNGESQSNNDDSVEIVEESEREPRKRKIEPINDDDKKESRSKRRRISCLEDGGNNDSCDVVMID